MDFIPPRRGGGLWGPPRPGVAIIKKKKLGVSNTPYDGGRWVTDGGWCVTDGGWWVTDGGWWVATKHQRVAALVKKKKKAERPYGNPCPRPLHTCASSLSKGNPCLLGRGGLLASAAKTESVFRCASGVCFTVLSPVQTLLTP